MFLQIELCIQVLMEAQCCYSVIYAHFSCFSLCKAYYKAFLGAKIGQHIFHVDPYSSLVLSNTVLNDATKVRYMIIVNFLLMVQIT